MRNRNMSESTTVSLRRQQGMTLLELMIAITVLAVGMAAVSLLFATAMMTNSRAKTDTTGTMLAQKVLDELASVPGNVNPLVPMTDCNPAGATVWNIATTDAPGAGAGATLVAATGSIDFVNQTYAAVPNNYKMLYVVCGGNGQQVPYDVRWNITMLSATSRVITVSARQLGAGAASGANRAILFALPVTLRTIAGS